MRIPLSRRTLSSTVMTAVSRLLILIALATKSAVEGGYCWTSANQKGRCAGAILGISMTKEDCCNSKATGFGVDVHWSSDDLTSGKLFYYRFLGGGAPNCESCGNTCEGVVCGRNKKCAMRRGKPKCVCSPDCSQYKHRGPVCGTDQVSHLNHCSLLKYNCRHHKYVDVDYVGSCKKSCAEVDCGSQKHCMVDQHNVPHCIPCQQKCPEPSGPDGYICGSDAVTYESKCHLRAAGCKQGRSITIAYHGKCQGNLTCETLSCANNRVCIVDVASNHPRCSSCSMYCDTTVVKHVCGTDNTTYPNWCSMQQAACDKGVVIDTWHLGRCGDRDIEMMYYDASIGSSENSTSSDEEETNYVF